jgi:hypothetical protein
MRAQFLQLYPGHLMIIGILLALMPDLGLIKPLNLAACPLHLIIDLHDQNPILGVGPHQLPLLILQLIQQRLIGRLEFLELLLEVAVVVEQVLVLLHGCVDEAGRALGCDVAQVGG